MGKPVYADGFVHVMAKQCKTCVFRPGNRMDLEPGRLEQMIRDATAAESCIPCHKTTYDHHPQEAVCRGFFLRHKTQPLQVAERLGLIEEVDVD